MNFEIENKGIISENFLNLGINDFNSACIFISKLPYKRNTDKENLTCVFDDECGTCSTKHATLRKLALENNQNQIKLILGIFKMDAEYAPEIEKTLAENNLNFIPEAHNYLKIEDEYFDFTNPNSNYSDVKNKILKEIEIEYDQINSYKIEIHKKFLEDWIIDKPMFSQNSIWKIREKCIEDLQNKKNIILNKFTSNMNYD